jgi:DNA-damage-inducible protein J
MPFEVFVPNAETIEALEAARRGEVKTCDTVEELFEDLNSDD